MTALDDGLGALFIGLIVTTLLHGVTLSQAWHFFSSQSRQFKDPLGLKVLVTVVVALDFIHQLCTSHWLYTSFVTNYGKFEELTKLPPSYLGMAIPTGFATLLVQSFYVWRIWKLANEKWLIPGFIFLCSCGQEGIQLYSMSVVARNPDSAQFTGTMTRIVIAVNGMGAGIDVIIALAMVFLLAHRRTRIHRTNRMLRQIAIYSVTTGAATGVCAILVLVTAVKLPGTQYVLLFYLMLTRMYSNSLLATLNVRESILKGKMANSGIVTSSELVTHPRFTPQQAESGFRLNNLKRDPSPEEGISIKIDTKTEVQAI